MSKYKRVALYLRISTNEERQNLGTQRHALTEYVEARGWGVVEEYSDVVSGRDASREDYNRLKQDARRRAFDTVLVWKFDRFARSTAELVNSLAEFDALGIDFVSYTEQFDTTTPTGRAMFALVGVFAEFEASLASERIRAGLQRAKAEGKRLGRPPKDRFKHEESIVSHLQNGLSNAKTAKRLGCAVSHVEKVRKKRKSDL